MGSNSTGIANARSAANAAQLEARNVVKLRDRGGTDQPNGVRLCCHQHRLFAR
jgi:hypothetical protein